MATFAANSEMRRTMRESSRSYAQPVAQDAWVTEEQVRFFQEHGWIVSPRRLDASLLDGALRGLERHWKGERDCALPGKGSEKLPTGKLGYGDWMPGDPAPTRNNEYLSLQNFQVRELALSGVIGSVAARLTGSTSVRLFDDQMVYKPGGQQEAVVGWHVDGDYWGTCTSQNMLTAWIPLHDCPEEFGPLVVLDGSHKWSHLVDRSQFSFHKKDMDSLARYVNGLGFEFKPVVMEMSRGQFSFHHCRTIHGSHPNRASKPRIAFAAHLQDGDNRYQFASRQDGGAVELFNDRLCRKTADGVPDYADPAVFPTLWAQPSEWKRASDPRSISDPSAKEEVGFDNPTANA